MGMRTVPTHANCPACGKDVVLAEQTNLRTRGAPHAGKPDESYMWWAAQNSKYRTYLYWACNDCFASDRAIEHKMKFDSNPLLAYYDEQRTCKRCGKSFAFTKEQQQF